MRREAKVAVTTALVLLSLAVPRLTVAPTDAQAAPVDLKYALRPGDVIYYHISRQIQHTMEVGADRKIEEGRAEAREALRVLDVDPAGTMVVEWMFEDFTFTSGGRTASELATPIMVKIRPDGSVTEVMRGDYNPGNLLIVLPNRPIAVGESWSWQLAPCACKDTVTFRLDRVDQIGDERVAVIRAQHGGVSTDVPDVGRLPAGVTVRSARTEVRGSGELAWSLERGRIIRSAEDLTLDTQVEFATADQTLRIHQVIRMTEKREPLTSELIPVSTTAQDQLIVPGKGAGPWTLDLPVSGLTTRYGAPSDRGVRSGFRARTLAWEAGPTGLLDPADADRLVGLEMSGQNYRTDKGIGFGSSEGAVLLAYGMTPTKFEPAVSGAGATRFLIYDDQGIAFAINLDTSPSGSAAHAPAGTVEWVVVFVPGDAGKIFELP